MHNSALREPGGLVRLWTGEAGTDYLPLKSSAQWLEWRLWADQPAGYHAVNVALHLLSAFLLWRLLRQLGLGPLGAWLGGLIFALHPLAVESVAWISEFKNTLSLPPFLLALSAWVDWEAGRGRSLYARAWGWFLIALLCKTSVVMLPLILLGHAGWRRGRITRRDLVATLPFFLLALGFGAVTVAFQRQRAIAGVDLQAGGLVLRSAAAGGAAVFYFCRGFFPLAWAPIYPRWSGQTLGGISFLPWAVLAASGAWLGLRSARAAVARTAAFGLGFSLLNVVPILGIIPMAYDRISLISDHLAYVSLLGYAALLGAAAQWLWGWSQLGKTSARLGLAAGALLLIFWADQSRQEARVFHDERAFWAYALARNPASWTAENNLGKILLSQGRKAEAEPHFRAALRLNPADAEAHFNLALILTANRRWDESLAHDRVALQLRPNFPEARRALGNTLLQAGRLEEAIPELEAALRLRPEYAEARADLGVTYASLGRLSAGIEELNTAVRLQPLSVDAHNNLGVTLLRNGQMRAAAAEFRAALRLNPADAGARANLARAEQELGN